MGVKSQVEIIKKKDIKMNEITIKNNVLENKNFKQVVFAGTLLTGVLTVLNIVPSDIGLVAVLGSAIMNLGYIQKVRDSSKVDSFYKIRVVC